MYGKRQYVKRQIEESKRWRKDPYYPVSAQVLVNPQEGNFRS